MHLAVDGNRLTSLPSDIDNLAGTLTLLTVSSNNVSSLPYTMSMLKNLEVLDMRNNSLTSLPPWNELTSLVHLTIAGNPLCENGWMGAGRVKELMQREGEGCAMQCSHVCLNVYLSNKENFNLLHNNTTRTISNTAKPSILMIVYHLKSCFFFFFSFTLNIDYKCKKQF